MTQSRLGSAVEAGANVAIGYGINVAANLLILPLLGFAVSLADGMAIGVAFTLISLARSYVLRRLFNRLAGRA